MEKTGMIGVDPGKRSFQLRGVREDGTAAFRKKVSRERFLAEVSGRGPRIVAMEACGSARHRGRELRSPGFEVRPVPPVHVKPFVKRHKNDAARAEAVCEAASRPGMRFVAAESAERQGEAMLFRTRDLPVRQRTRTADALRGHPAEHGVVAPQGIANVARLAAAVDDPESRLPETVRAPGRELLEQIGILDAKIGKLDAEARKRAKESGEAKRLTGIPGIGPVCAMATQAFAPPMEGFRRGRDFPASARPGEAEARPDLEDGAARPPAAARCRGDRGHPLGVPARNRRSLAGRAAEQDGADGPGRRDDEGTLQSSRVRPGDGRRTEAAGTNVEMNEEFFRGSAFA